MKRLNTSKQSQQPGVDVRNNGDIQNDSKDTNKIDEGVQEHSNTSSPRDRNANEDNDDHDPAFSLEMPTSIKKSRDKHYSCDLCDQKFSNKYSIPTHKKLIHGIIPPKPEKPFSCKFCPNKFGTRVSLLSHIFFRHRGQSILNRPFRCDICGRGSTTQNGVALHKKKVHRSEPPAKNKPVSSPEKLSQLKNSKTLISRPECDDSSNNESESVDVKMENSSTNGDDLDDGGVLQNDSNDCGSLNWDANKIDEQDQDHSGLTSSPSSSETDEDNNDDDNEDLDFTAEKKETPSLKSPDKGPFRCDLCDKKFSFKSSMTAHKKTIHGFILPEPSTKTKPTPLKNISCTFCPKSFKDSTSWSRHLNAKHKGCKTQEAEAPVTSSLPYSCPECPMSFDTQRQKTYHIYTIHKKDKKTGGFMKRLENAMRTDTSDHTQQSCVACSKEFNSWKLLHYHLKQKHEKLPANKKSLMCYFCNQLFCYEQSVWAHLKTCITHNCTKIEFPCDHVDHLGYSQWAFNDPKKLESHFKEEHGDCEVLKCSDCGFPCLDKNMLELHKLVHLTKIKEKYHCPGCSNFFLNTDTLQHHYNSIHGVSLKFYRCKNCGMGFSGKSALPLHVSRCLKGSGNEDDTQQAFEFLCAECPKSYETAYQLKNHVRMIHTTDQCPDCGLVLAKSKLSHHKIMKHGEERFLCTLCGKAYKTRTLLQTHMSSHGQYRWICKYCGSGSRSSHHLKRHIGRMHKDKLAEEAAAKISSSGTT